MLWPVKLRRLLGAGSESYSSGPIEQWSRFTRRSTLKLIRYIQDIVERMDRSSSLIAGLRAACQLGV